MIWETKQVLVTVKTYPNPSKKYGETVCVAGIELANNKWIRLYPIPFRDLESVKRFEKYDIIEVKAAKSKRDSRPESFKVNFASIKIVDKCGTKDNWKKRKEVVLPTVSSSFCEIYEQSKNNIKSLGVFKPKDIGFIWKKARNKNIIERKSCYAQLPLFSKAKEVIEAIPYEFKYSFFCKDVRDCKGHVLPIIDWELIQSYRSWRRKYKGEDELFAKIKEKWLDGMFSDERDTYVFVGNWQQFRGKFMILGVFYPPKE